ncbi:MAG TPA: PAS domain-containing protein [Rhodothermales bacterium]|nr:PAS domain-containing protein [Rhodothermales bacterium]
MPTPSLQGPSVRAAAAALVALTVAAVVAVGLSLSAGWGGVERAARAEAAATARAAAVALDGRAARPEAAAALLRRLAPPDADGATALALVDARGRLVAASDPDRLNELSWSAVIADTPPPAVTVGRQPHFLVVEDAPGGAHLAALVPHGAVRPAYQRASWLAIGVGAGLWGLVAALIIVGAWYAGPRAGARLAAVAARIGAPDGPTGDDLDRFLATAMREFGPLAAPLTAVGVVADRSRDQLAETRGTLAALLQINPHYILLCTLDGHIVDANPAFYAVTGLPFEAVRGNRIEVLNEVMPVEPLFDLARRSARDGASLSGIEYALMNREEQRRQVLVSLRAVTVNGKAAVVIQATDVAVQRMMERQIAQFSDALDLMVDQRVAQLTAGNAAVDGLLDAAGVAVASFDVGGGTRRLNAAAEALVGGRLNDVPHLSAFVLRLGLPPAARDAFQRWVQGEGPPAVRTALPGSDGTTRTVVWRRGDAGAEGHADRRVLVGLELPTAAATASTGDGAAHATPPDLATPDA